MKKAARWVFISQDRLRKDNCNRKWKRQLEKQSGKMINWSWDKMYEEAVCREIITVQRSGSLQ